MAWSLHILGTNAAVPSGDRHPSSLALDVGGELILIDCGENTQVRISDLNLKKSRIRKILISHLHGDHVFGLPGLITSYNLFDRKDTLDLYGPAGLDKFVKTILDVTNIKLQYLLRIHEHPSTENRVIFDGLTFKISTIPLRHRIPCTGYMIEEKVKPRKIDAAKVGQYEVPYSVMDALQMGQDWIRPDGTVIPNSTLTIENREGRRFAYCSDTLYSPEIMDWIKGVDVLYHEATFDAGLTAQAALRGHCTSHQAALIAAGAKAHKLVIGHFSGRYKDPDLLGVEARSIFPNTVVSKEGNVITF